MLASSYVSYPPGKTGKWQPTNGSAASWAESQGLIVDLALWHANQIWSFNCYFIVTECDPNCASQCTTRGANKCDSLCQTGYSLMITGSAYTCVRTYSFSVIWHGMF